jgi:hypothetical protein
MLPSLKTLTLGVSGAAIATLCATSFAPSALAFSITSNGGVQVDTTDLNKSFTVNLNGSVATQAVAGLTSEATFKFLGFTPTTTSVTTGTGANRVTTLVTKTVAQFEILLKNTSSGSIGSRVSALGFNTDKTELSGSSTGVFTKAQTTNAAFPNQFGAIDVCYTNGNTCQGGQNGGVSNKTTLPGTYLQDTFIASLTLDGAVDSFILSNFGVRYQSISGTNLGTSGTGKVASVVLPPPPPPKVKKVPEPAIASSLAVAGLAVLKRKKKQQVNA